MTQSTLGSKLQLQLYRLSTICKSLKDLYTLPDERVQAFLDSYTIYDHDWADEEQLIQEMGPSYYKEVKKKIGDYYGVLNILCSIGQVEKMYIPPALDLSKSIIDNQLLYEKKMSGDLGIKKDDKVLDIGCGRGRVANHVASHTGAQVFGINLDPVQLESAVQFTAKSGRSKQCHFKQADMNDLPLPFADNFFDAIYQIQVFTYSKNLSLLFKDLHRILKPGGKIAFIDWMSLPDYDPKNPHHLSLMKRVKPLIAAIGTPTPAEYVRLFKSNGFEVLTNENPSIDGLQAPLIENADRFFNRLTGLIKFLVKCKLVPAFFQPLFERFIQDGQAFVEADRLRLLTTCHYFVAQKKK